MTATLSRYADVPSLVAEYQAAMADIEAAFARIDAAERRLQRAFSDDLMRLTHHRIRFSDFKFSSDDLTRSVWRSLVDRLGVRRIMSVKRSEELLDAIERGPLPELTEENVNAMCEQYIATMGQMHEEAVQEVFNFLRPIRNAYKTNSKFEIGPKVVLEWLEPEKYTWAFPMLHHNMGQRAQALENVFRVLDGKVGPSKGAHSDLESAIHEARRAKSTAGETEYFKFRCFRKGTLHIEFKRLDLVEKFNKVAGGMNLRA